METPTRPRRPRETVPPVDEIAESECLGLLRTADVGRLAVQLVDGGVDIFPVNFVVDEGTIVLRTASGTKLDSIGHEPLVAFEVDHFDWYEGTAWSVVVKGRTAVVTDRNELLGLANVMLGSWQSGRKPFFVRICPSTMTGRRFAVQRAAH